MRTGDQLCAYLNSDGTAIIIWSGGKLARVTYKVSRRVGFNGSTRVYLNAIDDTGKRWHGTSPGPDMYARLRATREKTARATPIPHQEPSK